MSVNDAVPRADASTAPNSVARDRHEDTNHPECSALSHDQIFHLLQNERRRAVLRYLRDADAERVRMRDIAEAIAAAEHETTVDALSSKQRQRVYVPLYQNHLPKLDAEGVVHYEQDRGVVERRSTADQLERHLWASNTEVDDEAADEAPGEPAVEVDETATRPRWYLGAAFVGALLFGGATLDVSVFAAVPDVVVSASVLCLLVAVVLWSYAIDSHGSSA